MSTADFPGSRVLADLGKSLRIRVPTKKDGSDNRIVTIPKSQIHDDSEVYDAGENSEGKLVIPEWLAEDRGLL